jgi:dTDP-4-amino-4,6-dideoxygalactose transaminase
VFASARIHFTRWIATEAACREVLSLPVYPELTAGQREEVVARVREFFEG